MALAPIALFVYNRLDHTERTVAALRLNELAADSDLIIFSDAAKNEAAAAGVQAVRAYLKGIAGFRSVRIVERPTNLGLAASIIGGVTEIVGQYGKIIVLEDDLETSPYFLRYMNEALDLYDRVSEVISIHAYVYPVRRPLPESFFLRGADCWGWATWRRGWDLFEADGRKLLAELQERRLSREFDLDGSYPYTQMLRGQIKGFNNSWAIRWHAAAFLRGKLTLYPGRSLVANTGFDHSGTHAGKTKSFYAPPSTQPVAVQSRPLLADAAARAAVVSFFRSPRLRLLVGFIRLKFYARMLRWRFKN